MPEQDPPYDPYIPSGGQAGTQQAGGAGGNARTQALQAVSFFLSTREAVAFSSISSSDRQRIFFLSFLTTFLARRGGATTKTVVRQLGTGEQWPSDQCYLGSGDNVYIPRTPVKLAAGNELFFLPSAAALKLSQAKV